MKWKYFYEKNSGLIYRANENGTYFMRSSNGKWIASFFDSRADLMNLGTVSNISPIVVHYFERNGGYLLHFRTRID